MSLAYTKPLLLSSVAWMDTFVRLPVTEPAASTSLNWSDPSCSLLNEKTTPWLVWLIGLGAGVVVDAAGVVVDTAGVVVDAAVDVGAAVVVAVVLAAVEVVAGLVVDSIVVVVKVVGAAVVVVMDVVVGIMVVVVVEAAVETVAAVLEDAGDADVDVPFSERLHTKRFGALQTSSRHVPGLLILLRFSIARQYSLPLRLLGSAVNGHLFHRQSTPILQPL